MWLVGVGMLNTINTNLVNDDKLNKNNSSVVNPHKTSGVTNVDKLVQYQPTPPVTNTETKPTVFPSNTSNTNNTLGIIGQNADIAKILNEFKYSNYTLVKDISDKNSLTSFTINSDEFYSLLNRDRSIIKLVTPIKEYVIFSKHNYNISQNEKSIYFVSYDFKEKLIILKISYIVSDDKYTIDIVDYDISNNIDTSNLVTKIELLGAINNVIGEKTLNTLPSLSVISNAIDNDPNFGSNIKLLLSNKADVSSINVLDAKVLTLDTSFKMLSDRVDGLDQLSADVISITDIRNLFK